MNDRGQGRTVAEAIIETLIAHGVEVAFGIPGVHNLALWEAARMRDDFEVVGVRHEQAAVYAADGVARQTRMPVAAFTITGPGAANAAGAFGEAASCDSPVVLIATEVALRGRSERSSFGRVHGSPDQGAIFESLAKGVFRTRRPSEVVAAVTEALVLAKTAPQGPVYVDVPTDILSVPVEDAALEAALPPASQARSDLSQFVNSIERAERPLLWAGGGAATDEGAAVVRQLSERLGAPVITTFAGRGIVSPSDPGWIGLPVHEPDVIDLMADADLLIGLGSAFDGMNTRNWNLPFPAEFFCVNVADTHLLEEGVPHVAISGDVVDVGTELLAQLDSAPRLPWADLDARRDKAMQRLRGREMQPSAISLLASVDEALKHDEVVLADMAIAGYWAAGYAEPIRPRQLLYPVGWGTLGFALPASIGAGWAAKRECKRVLVVCGDGGFMFAIGELATIRENQLPISILVVDDGGYGMLRFDQDVDGMENFGVDLWVPDIQMIGKAFDIPSFGVAAEDTGELQSALGLRGDIDGPRLIHVKARIEPPRTTSPRWREVEVVTSR